MPDFYSTKFLRQHVSEILAFYRPNAIDPNGGYRQNYLNNGDVFDDQHKHLVSSCRMIFNFCKGEQHLDQQAYWGPIWAHGLNYLRERHWQNERLGYIWQTSAKGEIDETNQCYGLAFVMLAFATALKAGDSSSQADLYHCWALLEQHFWQPEQGLYADEISPDWRELSDYRGQNANMHCCEAFILAFEATQDDLFLNRAEMIANKIALELAAKSDGLIWEHFDNNLNIDWDYNKDDPANLYRPWGFQPGHQTEWTKLLLMLNKHRPKPEYVTQAEFLFNRALEIAWDKDKGGIFYGFAPNETICDDNKYFWVQAESFAAAALLYQVTDNHYYLNWYNQIWDYCWTHFVDHEHGAWYRWLDVNNQHIDQIKSLAGAKCDYHTLGACTLVLEALEHQVGFNK